MSWPRRRTARIGAGIALGVVAAAALRRSRRLREETETVPYTVVATLGEVELRRYPPLVTVETVAATENEAFRRLFRYIAGASDGTREFSMTVPVSVGGRGESIPMTTPVEVGIDSRGVDDMPDDGVRMAFSLPAAYSTETVPAPTDHRVSVVSVPERTLAVRQFSWRPTAARVASERDALLAALDHASVATVGEPFYMGYDAPWTLPWRRRNEVAVEVADGG